jgi:hypothetical protein
MIPVHTILKRLQEGKYLKHITLCVILSISFCNLYAQDVNDDETIASKNGYTRYLGFGVGAAYRMFLDPVVSSIRYSKIGATGSITNIKTNETKYTELYFQASYLEMNRPSDALLKAHVKVLNGVMDYKHLYKIDLSFLNDGIYDVRAGGMFSTQFCTKNAEQLGNSSRVKEYDVSLGASIKFARQQFTGDRKSYLTWELSIPFIAMFGRPGYLNQAGTLNIEHNSFNDFFAYNSFGTFGKFMRLNSRLSYLYSIKNGNKLRFTYQWDYYKMKNISGKAYNIEHSFIMTYLFNY